jgi:hypothetical protein
LLLQVGQLSQIAHRTNSPALFQKGSLLTDLRQRGKRVLVPAFFLLI